MVYILIAREYPAWLCQQFAIENDPVEIVFFPINNGDFPQLC